MFLGHVEDIRFKHVREEKLIHCPLCDKVRALHSENTTLCTIFLFLGTLLDLNSLFYAE
jgi:hypothetical protein